MGTTSDTPVAALLLTGGRSRRMGSDKARLADPRTGLALAQRTAALVKEVADVCVEVGPGHTDLPAVIEHPAGAGPLAGIAAGARAIAARLASTREVPVLVLATDLPLMDAGALRWLLDRPGCGTVVPIVAGRAQTLGARWNLGDLLRSGELVARGESRVTALVDACPGIEPCYPDEGGGPGTDPWTDVDTRAEAESLALRPQPTGAGLPRSTTAVKVIAVTGEEEPGAHRAPRPDRVVTEEPLEIRAGGPGQEPEAVVVTMRTPGNDFELAAGFLVTEGLVGPGEIAAVGYCDARDLTPEERWNVVSVALRTPWTAPAGRRFTSTSSCGVCGKTSIDDVALACPVVPPSPKIDPTVLVALPDRMRDAQRLFDSTGGLHAAALFDGSGRLELVREDVGRHNAVDKVIGQRVLHHREGPGQTPLLAVSGRVSFEITQKAAMAGIGVIAAVSAPSSLAVSAADRLGVTIAGFVRGGRANLYTHPERINLDS